MKAIKIITTTAALVLALSGHASAQGSLGDSGTSGAARGSAVQSAPSAVESSKELLSYPPPAAAALAPRVRPAHPSPPRTEARPAIR